MTRRTLYAACFILLVGGFGIAASDIDGGARYRFGMGILFVGLALAVGILVREVWLIARGEVRNDERRVLDPNEQAHARRMGDTWVVSAGFVSILCADRDDAETTAIVHNAMRAHVPGVVDRRKS